MADTKQFKVDFFCVSSKGKRKHTVLKEALEPVTSGGCLAAVALEGGSEKHQLRSIVPSGRHIVYKAVFGRCRYNESLTQGDENGAEADVVLKPGHGLVEKNHLLYIPGKNLLVYQRNGNGSHHSKLQAYLNRVCGGSLVLEPILQRDAYKQLIDGGAVRRVEVSFMAPADPSLYEGVLTQRATSILQDCGASTGYLKMSVGRHPEGMPGWIKEAVVSLARSGISKIARLKLEDVEEPIDLIADRLVKSVAVEVGANGKATADAYFSALENARTDASDALETFFGG